MATKAFFRRERVPLKANEARVFNRPGEYFAVLGSTGSFEIGIEDQPLSDWSAGLRVGNRPDENGRRPNFRFLRLLDTSGGDNVIDIVVGGGEFTDQRLTVSGTVVTQPVKNTVLATVADVALVAITATSIVAANAARREVMITNLTAGAIRVGDANVAVARGVQVAAGATITLETSAEVFGFSTPGGNVAVTEILD